MVAVEPDRRAALLTLNIQQTVMEMIARGGRWIPRRSRRAVQGGEGSVGSMGPFTTMFNPGGGARNAAGKLGSRWRFQPLWR